MLQCISNNLQKELWIRVAYRMNDFEGVSVISYYEEVMFSIPVSSFWNCDLWKV